MLAWQRLLQVAARLQPHANGREAVFGYCGHSLIKLPVLRSLTRHSEGGRPEFMDLRDADGRAKLQWDPWCGVVDGLLN